MSDRKLRTRVTKSTESWYDLANRGYKAFTASASSFNDGSEACQAAIAYLPAPDADFKFIYGTTGQGAGHAEMHALTQFITNVCGGNVDTFSDYANGAILVSCESKPCCYYCSAVLGLLDIGPWSSATMKSPKRMGGTQWSTMSSLRMFLSAYTGVPESEIAKFDSTKL